MTSSLHAGGARLTLGPLLPLEEDSWGLTRSAAWARSGVHYRRFDSLLTLLA